ncbi:MAG: hypothetical protein EAX86_02050 [Candidatus Heimdallarchaeota archaeon]|nr:hypothetical protein [Candidatus Heimdallarchaeota archaeon]
MTLGLDTLNLTHQESKVYITLLALGPLSLGEIIQHTGFSLDDTTQCIDVLKNKGYLHVIPGVAIRYRVILPLDDLKSSTEATISKMEDLAAQLDEHISKKLGVIITKLREEAKKVKDGVAHSQENINQSEMKAENEVEARIAKFSLDVEESTGQTKQEISSTMDEKKSEHQNLIEGLEDSFKIESNRIKDGQQAVNKNLMDKFHSGLDELVTQESERVKSLTDEQNDISETTGNLVVEGIENVRQAVNQTGTSLFSSIDQRNERLTSSINTASTEISTAVSEFSTENQERIISSLKTYNDKIQQQIGISSKEATDIFSTTGEEVKTKTAESVQNLQQALNTTLKETQTQIAEILTKTKENFEQKIVETQNQIETKMNELTTNVQNQTDDKILKVITNSETMFKDFAQESDSMFEITQNEVNTAFTNLVSTSSDSVTNIKNQSLTELNRIVDALKTEVKLQIDSFNEALKPQELKIREEFSNFRKQLSLSQDQGLASFNQVMTAFKTSIDQKHQELNDLVSKESQSLIESVNQYLKSVEEQLTGYDSRYRETLVDSAVRNSEKLIAQTRDIQEQMKSTVGEFSKIASEELSMIVEVVTQSVDAEVKTLENELTDYSYKFNEVTQANQEIFRNYLHSIEKIDSLIKDTKQPVVETAPIVSKEATLTYVKDMFSRITSGITLLIPKIEDVPIDLILATKTSQRVSLVTICKPEKDKDFLQKLLQKPNVRIRAVDPVKFEDVDKYIAADRDGEEVIIGVTEDSGEVLAIASLADSFIKLMGKIVLGDYFLARSQEIQRSDLGL